MNKSPCATLVNSGRDYFCSVANMNIGLPLSSGCDETQLLPLTLTVTEEDINKEEYGYIIKCQDEETPVADLHCKTVRDFKETISCSGQEIQTNNAMEHPRGYRDFWTDEETRFMLNQLKEMKIQKLLDGRVTRNGEISKKVALKMVEAGFPARTHEQVMVRWQDLKKAYSKAKRDNGGSGRGSITCPFYDVLEELLVSLPRPLVGPNRVVPGVQLATTMDTTMDPEETKTTLLGCSPGSSSPRATPSGTPPPSRTPLPTTTTAYLPGTRTQQRSRQRRDVDVLVNQMQVMYQEWMEDMERSEAREERLIASILQSTDRMVEKLMQRIDNILPQPITFSPPPQHHHHQQQPPPPQHHHQPAPPPQHHQPSPHDEDIGYFA